MTNPHELQPIPEPLGRGYVYLVRKEDVPENLSVPNLECFRYPGVQTSNIGLVSLGLERSHPAKRPPGTITVSITRAFSLRPDDLVTAIDVNGQRALTYQESKQQGYYLLDIMVENPEIKRRGITSRINMISDSTQDDYSAKFINANEAKELVDSFLETVPDEYREHKEYLKVLYGGLAHGVETRLISGLWENNTTGEIERIVVPNDAIFLSSLGFKFEFVQPAVPGGDVN